jgi:hypothetical protein
LYVELPYFTPRTRYSQNQPTWELIGFKYRVNVHISRALTAM